MSTLKLLVQNVLPVLVFALLGCNEFPSDSKESVAETGRGQVFAAQVAGAPVITEQPQTIYGSTVGNTLTFSVVATGQEPLTYTWRRNGSVIPQSNSATYTRTALLPDSGASFSCLVSNALGNVTSASATAYFSRAIFEAEKATLTGVTTSSKVGNYSGTGYVDYGTVAGGVIKWNVQITNPATYNLLFRFSNSVGSTASAILNINGTQVKYIDFQTSGGPGVWLLTSSIPVNFSAGLKEISLTTTTRTGLFVDRLEMK